MQDWLLSTVFVVATVAVVVEMPIKARRVRDGRARMNFKGTREEVVAKYRRHLGWIAWLYLVAGALSVTLLLIVVLASDADIRIWHVGVGVLLLSAGVSSLRSRRILDSPPSTPAAGQNPQESHSTG